MAIEIIDRGVVVHNKRGYNNTFEDAFRFDRDYWTSASSDLMAWQEGVLRIMKLTIRGRPCEFKSISNMIRLRREARGAQRTRETLLTGTWIGTTPTRGGGLRAHIYHSSREEQIELVKYLRSQSRYVVILPTYQKLAKKVRHYSEDNRTSFNIPEDDIKAFVRPRTDGRSDYDLNEIVQNILTAEGANENGSFIHHKYRRGCEDPKGPKGEIHFTRPKYLLSGNIEIRPLRLRSSGVIDADICDTGLGWDIDFGVGYAIGGRVSAKKSL